MDKNKKYNRFYIWLMKRNFDPFFIVLVIAGVVANILASYFELEKLATITVIVTFVFAVIYFISFNQQSLFDFLHGNQNVSHLPEKQIRRLNKTFLLIFLVVAVVIMFIFMKLPYEIVLSSIWEVIRTALRFLFSLFRSSSNSEEVAEEITPALKPEIIDFSDEAQTINPVFEFIILAFGIIFIAMGVILVIYSFYKKIHEREKVDVNEYREFISPFAKKEEVLKPLIKEKHSIFKDLSYNGRVRRLYKKTVLKKLPSKHKPLNPLTPLEIEIHTDMVNEQENLVLHEIYEKARYSENGCSKQDYEVVKNI